MHVFGKRIGSGNSGCCKQAESLGPALSCKGKLLGMETMSLPEPGHWGQVALPTLPHEEPDPEQRLNRD